MLLADESPQRAKRGTLVPAHLLMAHDPTEPPTRRPRYQFRELSLACCLGALAVLDPALDAFSGPFPPFRNRSSINISPLAICFSTVLSEIPILSATSR